MVLRASNLFMGCFIMDLHKTTINLKSYFYQVFIFSFPSGTLVDINIAPVTRSYELHLWHRSQSSSERREMEFREINAVFTGLLPRTGCPLSRPGRLGWEGVSLSCLLATPGSRLLEGAAHSCHHETEAEFAKRHI